MPEGHLVSAPPLCQPCSAPQGQAESGGMVLVAYAGPVRPAAALRDSVLCLPTDIHSLFVNKPSSSSSSSSTSSHGSHSWLIRGLVSPPSASKASRFSHVPDIEGSVATGADNPIAAARQATLAAIDMMIFAHNIREGEPGNLDTALAVETVDSKGWIR